MAKKSASLHDREKELKNDLDTFWKNVISNHPSVINGDSLYDSLSLQEKVDLKVAISDINNIITLKTTQKFLGILHNDGILPDSIHKDAVNLVNSTGPNTNGYDVQLNLYPNFPGLIAEVKCNIPVGNKSFGAKQYEGIAKDLFCLYNPKAKTTAKDVPDTPYKFMVILGNSANVKEAVKKVLAAMNDGGPKYLEKYFGQKDGNPIYQTKGLIDNGTINIEEYDSTKKPKSDGTIYICYIPLT